ncbi:hypothetical protein [Cryptosporangium aurantiacum]|uniref:Uncharacterized protein n=1 Tax=Cryptosporangium aurantiacum TaxID=134849 RepID=A0A1M7RJM4_9ACTN|nr:hypothetical protein [Cryptosporangium aurantiacum]SHN46474.1 hypothetical protein SAMN05443668_11610 [Cryptosporangium aurantiacum]
MLLRASASGVILDAPRDFTTLSLILEGPTAEAEAARVGRWADRDHLVVPAETLVELAGPVVTEIGWRDGFDTMIGHATRKGWVDENGGVRIHVEQR